MRIASGSKPDALAARLARGHPGYVSAGYFFVTVRVFLAESEAANGVAAA